MLLLPSLAAMAYVPIGLAPFAGVTNVVLCAIVTKGMPTEDSDIVNIVVTLFWAIPIVILAILDNVQARRAGKYDA